MDFAEQVKSSVDIAKVIGEYVRLRKASAQRYTGLCPFHTEKTPSFSVNVSHQFYYCFGCQAKGDVFNFLMQVEGLTFFEALKALAERNGIPIPARREHSDAETQLRAAVYRAHEVAAAHYAANLSAAAGAEARAYIAKRGLEPATVQQFGLGYADRSGRALLRALQAEKFTAGELEASGLVLKRDDGTFFDRFRNRLMFPIHNETGKVIAFGGRALSDEDEPKYLNSPETAIYKKNAVLYNLHRAKQSIRQEDRAVLVEGYMDVIGVFAAGVTEVVASCGTALTPGQVKAIKRHSERIVVNFDPDAAGAKAAERSVEMLLEESMHIRILELEGGLDPDEYIKERGADDYRAHLDRAQSYFHWLAGRARKRFDMKTAEGRIEGFKWLLPAIRKIHDRLERAAVAGEIAEYLGVDRGLVLEEFRRTGGGQARNGRTNQPPTALPKAEKVLLRSLLETQEVRDLLAPRLRGLSVISRFQSAGIIETIVRLYETKPDFSFTEVEGRLEEREKALLTEAVLADNSGEEVFSAEQARAYLAVLERDERHAKIAELRSRLREAERSGDLQGAMSLMDEISKLQRGG